jgi:hypothetical protein
MPGRPGRSAAGTPCRIGWRPRRPPLRGVSAGPAHRVCRYAPFRSSCTRTLTKSGLYHTSATHPDPPLADALPIVELRRVSAPAIVVSALHHNLSLCLCCRRRTPSRCPCPRCRTQCRWAGTALHRTAAACLSEHEHSTRGGRSRMGLNNPDGEITVSTGNNEHGDDTYNRLQSDSEQNRPSATCHARGCDHGALPDPHPSLKQNNNKKKSKT